MLMTNSIISWSIKTDKGTKVYLAVSTQNVQIKSIILNYMWHWSDNRSTDITQTLSLLITIVNNTWNLSLVVEPYYH